MQAVTFSLLLRRAGTGDVEARNEILERVAPRVAAIVRRMKIPPGWRDDMVQEAMLGLTSRLRRFDPSRGGFGPWLAFTTRSLVLEYLRRRGCSVVRLTRTQAAARRRQGLDLKGVCMSLDDERDGQPRLALESTAAPHPERVERRDLLDTALTMVSGAERRVLDLLYPRDGTLPLLMREAGDVLDVSQSRIAQLRNSGLATLRRWAGTAGPVPRHSAA